MITVCEKQTNKQTLRLLGSIGPKNGPHANNKLERNLLFHLVSSNLQHSVASLGQRGAQETS